MVMHLACDYAWKHPRPAAIRAAGYEAVIRYLSTDSSKDLIVAEVQQLHAVGLGIGVIYETTEQRAAGGGKDGVTDAADAVSQLRALGAPPGIPVFANVGDWAVTDQQLPAIRAYYHDWRHGLGEYMRGAGGYGTALVIEHLATTGAVGIWWQNAITDNGVSGDVVSAHASLYQRVKPVRVIAGADPGSWDESACGFGPVPVIAWWTGLPPVRALVSVSVDIARDRLVAYYSDGTSAETPIPG